MQLESGLEHDLLRDLDRDPRVTWLVSQAAQLLIRSDGRTRRGPVPDLLSVDVDGGVTVWAVRPQARQNERFQTGVEQTEKACVTFGWTHRVFAGMGPTRRMNLMWLDGYRRPMPWYSDALARLLADHGPEVTFAEVLAADAGGGHVLSATWHALRHGRLECDLDEPFAEGTELRFLDGGAG